MTPAAAHNDGSPECPGKADGLRGAGGPLKARGRACGEKELEVNKKENYKSVRQQQELTLRSTVAATVTR